MFLKQLTKHREINTVTNYKINVSIFCSFDTHPGCLQDCLFFALIPNVTYIQALRCTM